MRVTLLLADSAQAVNGKLYILGGGWSIIGPEPTPMAIAMQIDVPWDQANMPHIWRFELVTEDGQPVMVAGPTGDQPLEMHGQFEVGRPPGLRPGTPIGIALAINLGPLPIPHGGYYVWRFSVDGQSREEWRLAFSTRPQ